MDLIRQGKNRYVLPATKKRQVDVLVFLPEKYLPSLLEDNSLQQLAQAAMLPGTVAALGMPDIHSGFGLPIGGVLMADSSDAVISAGAVGMDINCGVRLLTTDIEYDSFDKQELKLLVGEIEHKVPAGVGKASRVRELADLDTCQAMLTGSDYIIAEGLGEPLDLEHTEERGCLAGANPDKAGKKALARSHQLGTLGGGNHFIEIGYVEEIYDPEVAATFDLQEGNLTILIHTGSRGFGHQICVDYSKAQVKGAKKYGIDFPVKGLAAVPLHSKEGQDYLAAMTCAVNFAFANRQIIMHYVREVFWQLFNYKKINLLYDVAHNIAKLEVINGQKRLIHRKGATRALPPGDFQNPAIYKETGHPAIIPGTMGTASYIVTGTDKVGETCNSVNHGAGRLMSRKRAKEKFNVTDLSNQMEGIVISTSKMRAILDEAPLAYKDIHDVVNTLSGIGITKKIARLKPLAVIKGVE